MSRIVCVLAVLSLASTVTAQPQPSWNRRVTGVPITTSAAGGAGTYDVTAEWRIDLVWEIPGNSGMAKLLGCYERGLGS